MTRARSCGDHVGGRAAGEEIDERLLELLGLVSRTALPGSLRGVDRHQALVEIRESVHFRRRDEVLATEAVPSVLDPVLLIRGEG